MYNARPLSVDEAPRLYQILNELSRRAEIRNLPQIYYVPSQLMNAFAVGTRDNAAIALTDGLLRNFNRTELIGILAHEISHVRNNDMKVMAVADVISRVTTIFSQVGIMLLFLNFPLLALGKAAISWFAVFLLIFAPTLSSLLQLALSRTREFNADIGAAVISGDPKGLAQALQKLEYYKCSMFERILMPGHKIPDPSLLRSHPKTEERVRRLLSLTEQKDRLLTADRDTIDIAPPGISHIKSSPRWRISGLWY
ncbi:MAG: M48 family metalloprotease [Candidatus Dadabacteria bacterium]|nr:M48 family metalloprotease [Candidatus Dadabacteria bacterium]